MSPPLRLPFMPQMVAAILAGTKTCTSRTRRYGRAGDVLESDAGPLRLTKVWRGDVASVAARRYVEEGFSSPDDFLAVWREIHPKARAQGYSPHFDRVWVHEFERVQQTSHIGFATSGCSHVWAQANRDTTGHGYPVCERCGVIGPMSVGQRAEPTGAATVTDLMEALQQSPEKIKSRREDPMPSEFCSHPNCCQAPYEDGRCYAHHKIHAGLMDPWKDRSRPAAPEILRRIRKAMR